MDGIREWVKSELMATKHYRRNTLKCLFNLKEKKKSNRFVGLSRDYYQISLSTNSRKRFMKNSTEGGLWNGEVNSSPLYTFSLSHKS